MRTNAVREISGESLTLLNASPINLFGILNGWQTHDLSTGGTFATGCTGLFGSAGAAAIAPGGVTLDMPMNGASIVGGGTSGSLAIVTIPGLLPGGREAVPAPPAGPFGAVGVVMGEKLLAASCTGCWSAISIVLTNASCHLGSSICGTFVSCILP